ncbi:hypothetical protein HFD88_010082 [Aspergillus terreus]|nr:hypothetical protein HFD88_010082 [Aspergillus terreus]
MASSTLFDYLRDDPTVINTLVDLSTPPAPASETEWISLSNEAENQVMHERNTAVEDPYQIRELTDFPVPLSTARHSMLSVVMDFCNFLTAYPKSHPLGYSYVINTKAAHPHLIKHPITPVQYTSYLVGSKKQIYCTFLNTRVEKFHYRCSGAKACEFLHEELKSLHHTEVSEEMFTKMANLRASLTGSKASPQQRATYRQALEVWKLA